MIPLSTVIHYFLISAVNGISLAKVFPIVFPSVSSQSKAAPLFGQILALALHLTSLTCGVQNMSDYNMLQLDNLLRTATFQPSLAVQSVEGLLSCFLMPFKSF